jgi:hypothetical protein
MNRDDLHIIQINDVEMKAIIFHEIRSEPRESIFLKALSILQFPALDCAFIISTSPAYCQMSSE